MITFEALDVILRVQNLPGFMARMRAGARSVSSIGKAAVDTNKKASTAIYAAARKATLALTAMAAIAAATGYKQSVEFEKQLTLVHTQAGATLKEMNAFKNPLLEMARTLPQGPIELAKGLYHIKSIGIPAAQAMEALRVAAEGAMVGNADLEQTTSALGAAWLAGIKGANGFRNTMAIMNATVGAGNMRMDELVTALGTGVLPTAKLAGLGIQDVMAALALLKDEGYGAYGAMAQFATALHFFTSPTKKASDAFKKLGLSQLDLADMMRKRGMVPTLALLRDRLKLTGEEMARLSDKKWAPETQQEKLLGAILPGGRGRVFRVLLNQVDRYQMKIDQINKTTGRFGEAIKKTQETAAVRLHVAWSSIQVDMVKLGDTIRGPVTDVLVFLLGLLDQFLHILIGIGPAIKWVKKEWEGLPWPIKATIAVIAIILAQFALIYAAVTFITIMKAAWVSLKLTIMAFRGVMMLLFMGGGGYILLIMAAIAVIILMITHWKETKAAAVDAWEWIKKKWDQVPGIVKAVLAVLTILIGQFYAVKLAGIAVAVVTNVFAALRAMIIGARIAMYLLWVSMGPVGWAILALSLLIGLIILKWGWFKKAGVDAFHWVKQAGIDAWHWIKNAANDFFNFVTNKYNALRDSGIISFFLGDRNAKKSPQQKKSFAPGPYSYGDPTFRVPGGYTGGYVHSGGVMDVGEHGKERIFLPEGSRIRPAGFRSMPGGNGGGGGGGQILEVHVHSYLDGKEVSENVSRHMANKKARK